MLGLNSEVLYLGAGKYAFKLYAYHLDKQDQVIHSAQLIEKNFTKEQYKQLLNPMIDSILEKLFHEEEPKAE